jgi:hypothetical protein
MWSCPGNMPKYYPGLTDQNVFYILYPFWVIFWHITWTKPI